ncbi:small, acid-soluble spore protein, alpha/beta type [Evansella sp. LMS18]|uniref:small, acid-soluble spore protein, alpha/beta type n=1 Tax=Evansella sp. LMS18 TaxID=2924033 RepID=UPI0020D0EC63|nr:small, acid-soluble spore protein, alpha/beta type [Evansella sp. LMS18]UTR10881.1 small, acid-soluble spore protein, alpha/beta type [Evansella sp. LMS18]
MEKRSKLVVKGVDEFMNSYSEEIAQEFGVFHSTTQTDQQAGIASATDKLLKKNKENK